MTPRRIWISALFLTAVAVSGYLWYKAVEHHSSPVVLKDPNPPRPSGALALSEKKVIRILSINGGGVRGIIPLMVLKYLEQKSGRRTAEMFDLVTGVSVGALSPQGVFCPDRMAPRVILPQKFSRSSTN